MTMIVECPSFPWCAVQSLLQIPVRLVSERNRRKNHQKWVQMKLRQIAGM
jgi:hypothetical protein